MSTLAKMEVVALPMWAVVSVLASIVLVIGIIGVVVFAMTRKPHK